MAIVLVRNIMSSKRHYDKIYFYILLLAFIILLNLSSITYAQPLPYQYQNYYLYRDLFSPLPFPLFGSFPNASISPVNNLCVPYVPFIPPAFEFNNPLYFTFPNNMLSVPSITISDKIVPFSPYTLLTPGSSWFISPQSYPMYGNFSGLLASPINSTFMSFPSYNPYPYGFTGYPSRPAPYTTGPAPYTTGFTPYTTGPGMYATGFNLYSTGPAPYTTGPIPFSSTLSSPINTINLPSFPRVCGLGPSEVYPANTPALWSVINYTEKPLFVPGEFLMRFKPGISPSEMDSVHAKYGTCEKYTHSRFGFKKVMIPPIDGRDQFLPVLELCALYNSEPSVEYAEPNFFLYAYAPPNDQFYNYQWHLKPDQTDVETAWEHATGIGVTVAVIDSGVAYENYYDPVAGIQYEPAWDLSYYFSALVANKFPAPQDFVWRDDHANDDYGHGTHVAGVIKQHTNNFYGAAGIAYNCKIMPIKALAGLRGAPPDWIGLASTADAIAEAVGHAVLNRAQIINMSCGSDYPSASLEIAINNAVGAGVVCIAAAGNDDDTRFNYPAAYPSCIAVSATTLDKKRAPYSTYGDWIDVCAPGGVVRDPDTGILIDLNGDYVGDGIYQQSFSWFLSYPKPPVLPFDVFTNFDFGPSEGTSFSAPIVSGIVALMLESNPGLTPSQVRDILRGTATKLSSLYYDDRFGYGMVNAKLAVLAAQDLLL